MTRERQLGSVCRSFVLSGSVLLAGAAALSQPLPAQTPEGPTLAMTEAQLRAIDERLRLTPAQKKAMAPIMRASTRAREATMKKHGIDPDSGRKPGLFKLLDLRRDMLAVTRWTRAQLAPILSVEQMQEYERISEEQKQRMKQRLMR